MLAQVGLTLNDQIVRSVSGDVVSGNENGLAKTTHTIMPAVLLVRLLAVIHSVTTSDQPILHVIALAVITQMLPRTATGQS